MVVLGAFVAVCVFALFPELFLSGAVIVFVVGLAREVMNAKLKGEKILFGIGGLILLMCMIFGVYGKQTSIGSDEISIASNVETENSQILNKNSYQTAHN